MSTDAIGYSLALITVGMTLVAVRGRHLLLTIGTSGLWAALLAFILSNTTAGANWQQILVISAFTFIIAMVMLGVFRDMTANPHVSVSKFEVESHGRGLRGFIHRLNGDNSYGHEEPETNGESIEEYRDRVHAALHKRARKP